MNEEQTSVSRILQDAALRIADEFGVVVTEVEFSWLEVYNTQGENFRLQDIQIKARLK